MARKWENAFFNLLITILIVFTVGAFVASPLTEARFEYVRDLPSSLKNYCTVCHTTASGGPLNTFGEDYWSSGLNINATAHLDSDGDGFTNEAELAAGTFPGDPNSYPGSSSTSMPLLEIAVAVVALVFLILFVFGVYRSKKKRNVSERVLQNNLFVHIVAEKRGLSEWKIRSQ